MVYRVRDRMVWRTSARGFPYAVLERAVPRIYDYALDVVIYLYPSRKDAEDGISIGGTGFLVGVRSEELPSSGWVYAVTNRHIVDQGCCVIRLNTKDGKADYMETSLDSWECPEDGADIAACNLGLTDNHKFHAVDIFKFLTEDFTRPQPPALLSQVGPGSDAYLLGRFINHEGQQQNLPTVRFGAISMMPLEPLYNRYLDNWQDSFLVEVRSMGGYSGSPVFVLVPKQYKFATLAPNDTPLYLQAEQEGYLLGVDWGHISDYQSEVVLKTDKWGIPGGAVETEFVAEFNTGMATVVPAWKLRDLINGDRFRMIREDEEKLVRERKRKAVVRPDNSSLAPIVINPEQKTRAGKTIPVPRREDFLRDLDKATRRLDKK
jgi:hypothetical protein